MSFLIRETVYPFSGFEGQMLFKGEPASGAKITRIYEHRGRDDRVEEVIFADKEGRFKFESVTAKYRAPLIPTHDYLCDQDILVEYGDETYKVWHGTKISKDEYAEFGGVRPLNLICEMTEELDVVRESEGLLGTTCQWENKK